MAVNTIGAGVVLNEGQIDVDFRVEGNNNANALIVDGGSDRVGIGAVPTAAKLEIHGGAFNTSLLIKGSGADTGIKFVDSAGNADGYVYAAGGEVGFLDDDADWMVNCVTDTRVELRVANVKKFIVDANSSISLSNNDSGTSNTIFGYAAGASLDAGSNYNVFIGHQVSDATMSDASGNIGMGYQALTALTTGDFNTAVGYSAGYTLTTSSNNVLIGNSAGLLIAAGQTTTDGTVAIGTSALQSLTSGAENVSVGYQAGLSLTEGGYNVAIGTLALSADTKGSRSVAIGRRTLLAQNFTSATDAYNTAVGFEAGNDITTGTHNTLIGGLAGDALSVGSLNTAVGHLALSADTKGDYNTAIGYNALVAQNFTSATNSFNTAVGVGAGSSNTDGQNNTFIGATAGDTPGGGHNNTIIGQGADCSNNDNQIAVGYVAIATATNETIWGNGSNTPNNITADWTVTSDKRIKKDIEDSDIGLSFVNSLRARKFKRKHPSEWDAEILEERYKRGGGNYDDEKDEVIKDEFDEEKVWNGLIAQEVKESMDELGVEFSGWNESPNSKQSIQYSTMVVPLIKAVQELSAKVEELKEKVGE